MSRARVVWSYSSQTDPYNSHVDVLLLKTQEVKEFRIFSGLLQKCGDANDFSRGKTGTFQGE